jgi:6-phosphofructokinase 1
MANMRKIGVLTSGGDAPGMNAAVRAVVRAGLSKGMEVMGIVRGYNGLIHGDMIKMDESSVTGILQKGGTVLGTARCLEFKEDAGIERAKDMCLKTGLDGIVVIGGDGSYRGARDLSLKGIPCVGLPGTIDNDISSTEYTIGYDTAMNTVVQMVDRLRDTSTSHDRCAVVEVMGRGAGWIALNAGIATGAIAILVPEVAVDVDRDIVAPIKASLAKGKNTFVVMVAEGIGHTAELAKEIEAKTGVESRATILGHVQRGGSPTLRDRVVATQMGYYAVELLEKGIGNRVVGLKGEKVVDYDILEGLNMKKPIDAKMLEIAKAVAL